MDQSFTPGLVWPNPRGRRAQVALPHQGGTITAPSVLPAFSDFENDFLDNLECPTAPLIDFDGKCDESQVSDLAPNANLYAPSVSSHNLHHARSHSPSHKIKQESNESFGSILGNYEDFEILHAPVPHHKPPHTVLVHEPTTHTSTIAKHDLTSTLPLYYSVLPQQYIGRAPLKRNKQRDDIGVVDSPRVIHHRALCALASRSSSRSRSRSVSALRAL